MFLLESGDVFIYGWQCFRRAVAVFSVSSHLYFLDIDLLIGYGINRQAGVYLQGTNYVAMSLVWLFTGTPRSHSRICL